LPFASTSVGFASCPSSKGDDPALFVFGHFRARICSWPYKGFGEAVEDRDYEEADHVG